MLAEEKVLIPRYCALFLPTDSLTKIKAATMSAVVETSNVFHIVLCTAFVLTLSSLYWVRALGTYRSNSLQAPRSRSLSALHEPQDPIRERVSRNGSKRLAPVADSVWYTPLAVLISSQVLAETYCREWVASSAEKCSIQPVVNLGVGLG